MMPDTSPRTPSRSAVLRAELVTQASESAPRPRTVATGRVAVAAVVTFALAGATTGAAVAATGVLTPPSSVAISMDEMLMYSFPGTEFLGTPLIVTGSDETIVDLGLRPDDATGLALRVGCIDAGRYDIVIDGVADGWVQCTESDVVGGPSLAGGSSQYELTASGPQTVTVRGTHGDRYVVWVSWSQPPVAPEPSQAQADALADGVVTREEYLAGLDRYVACMEASGWQVYGIDREADVVSYSIEAISGADDLRCYAAEFSELDMGWQVSRE